MSKHPALNAVDIESRAWQLSELFKVIGDVAPITLGDQVSIETVALLGRQLSTELAQYAIGDRNCMLGTMPLPAANMKETGHE